jgi:hypothetical protein
MITQQARPGGMPGSASGLSGLWILVLVLGLAVLAAIASAKAEALPAQGDKALLAVTIPLFFASAFAAVRMDARSGRQIRFRGLPVEAELSGADELQPAAEVERVHRWRSKRLSRLGLDREPAEMLAAEPAFSVHELERLLAAGCPLGTALRILRPD